MLQSYSDIINHATKLLRDLHFWHFMAMDEGHEGKHPECTTFSYDLITNTRCCACTPQPQWLDQHGTPRFASHDPKLCPDIYATEIALVLIACQACSAEFHVQMSSRGEYGAYERAPLSKRILAGTLHYGDPPPHDDCAIGATMNCYDLCVLQFWSFHTTTTWGRIPVLEVDLDGARQRKIDETSF